jgi:phenylpyruvate tautomerase PptA (4-oxalocrotonate tautomerase family)
MPKMFIHARQGTFTTQARARIAAELTHLGMACERLADTPQVRAGVWVYFIDHPADTVFRAGVAAREPIMSLKVYTIAGGLDAASKQRLITEATRILGEHSGTPDGQQVPAYVVALEVPQENWGMYGKQADLAALRG